MIFGAVFLFLVLLVAGFITKNGGGPDEKEPFEKKYNPMEHM